jgi:phosphoribosyl 1,2-cyclic phosphodiesterase
MSLYIASLNSGSNGNCYYIGNNTEAVLVDVGISCKETEKRMTRLGLNLERVKAIFISHEHSDHIRGVEVLSKKYKLPVYITHRTKISGGLQIEDKLHLPFIAYEPIEVGGLSITAFPKLHDAADPHSFVISGNGVNVGVFTDIGSECEHVIKNFKQCHAVFLEANYDHDMLSNGNYPIHLQNRIKSNRGHLSNEQALKIFLEHRSEHLSHLLLSHLSKDNNSPKLVHDLFTQHANNTEISIAGRDQETEVFYITGIPQHFELVSNVGAGRANLQMKLF